MRINAIRIGARLRTWFLGDAELESSAFHHIACVFVLSLLMVLGTSPVLLASTGGPREEDLAKEEPETGSPSTAEPEAVESPADVLEDQPSEALRSEPILPESVLSEPTEPLSRGVTHSLGLFSTFGSFARTHEEPRKEASFHGVFGEVGVSSRPLLIRVDFATADRRTGEEGLKVSTTYRELKLAALWRYPHDGIDYLYGGVGIGILSPSTSIELLDDSKSLTGQSDRLGTGLIGGRKTLIFVHQATSVSGSVFFELWGQTVLSRSYPRGSVSVVAIAFGYQWGARTHQVSGL